MKKMHIHFLIGLLALGMSLQLSSSMVAQNRIFSLPVGALQYTMARMWNDTMLSYMSDGTDAHLALMSPSGSAFNVADIPQGATLNDFNIISNLTFFCGESSGSGFIGYLPNYQLRTSVVNYYPLVIPSTSTTAGFGYLSNIIPKSVEKHSLLPTTTGYYSVTGNLSDYHQIDIHSGLQGLTCLEYVKPDYQADNYENGAVVEMLQKFTTPQFTEGHCYENVSNKEISILCQ